MLTIKIKPFSINQAWYGKHQKTKEYRRYEESMLFLLPKGKIPDNQKLSIDIIFSFSSHNSDVDNPTKPFIDILQKKYKFNDRNVYKVTLEKHIVKKGQESITFRIKSYQKSDFLKKLLKKLIKVL